MIFGFNTDIKHEQSTYHVQSEARVSEQLLQTQVFVQGRCIVKRAVSYSQRAQDATFTEEVMHETLREQHRWVVDAIRNGYLDELIKSAEEAAKAANTLAIRFVSSARPTSESIVLCFQSVLGDAPVGGVAVNAHIIPEMDAADTFTGGAAVSGMTDAEGNVEITLPVPAGAHGRASLVVEASREDQKIAKKFRLKAAASV